MTQTNDPNVFHIDWSLLALLNLICFEKFDTVLDIGSGKGEHARLLRLFGKKVYTMDLANDADYVGNFLDVKFDRKFDLVWCSHVLEHQRNVGRFLEKIYDECLADNGLLMIALPNHPRDSMISGHLTSWTPALLIYNLVYAGFDCSKAKFINTYDINLIARKAPSKGTEIRADSVHGVDVDLHDEAKEGTPLDHFRYLQQYFPMPIEHAKKSVTKIGEWEGVNWERQYRLPFSEDMEPFTIVCKNVNAVLKFSKKTVFEITDTGFNIFDEQ